MFSLTAELDAEFPAVAGGSRAFQGAADVHARGSGSGLAAARDQDDGPLVRRRGHVPRHVYLGAAPHAAGRPRLSPIGPRPWRLSLHSASAGSPRTRSQRATTSAPTRRCSPPTRPRSLHRGRPWPRAGNAGHGRRQPLSRSLLRDAAPRGCAERCGMAPERIALGCGGGDMLMSAGEALLEPGAEVVYAWPAFSVYPHLGAASGARAIQVPLDTQERHDLDAMAGRDHRRDRLVLICNPNNPTSTALGIDEIEAFMDAGAAAGLRDPRRGLLRVFARARRSVRVRRTAAPVSEPGTAAHLLEGTGLPGCGSATGCAAPIPSGPPSTRSANRSTSTAAAQAAAVEALRTRRGRACEWYDDCLP